MFEMVQAKKLEVKNNPEQYPTIPGQKYWIMVCDSGGNLIINPGKISPVNPTLKVMSFPEGEMPGRQGYICYEVN